jgi:virginiamycin A acetyltransferase
VDRLQLSRWIRYGLLVAAVFVTAPLWAAVRVSSRITSADDCFLTCSQLLAVFPGVVGIFLRRAFYWMCLESCSIDCRIGFATWLSHPQVRIGKRVCIGGRCTVGMCEIGDNTMIGSNVDILSGRRQHNVDDAARRHSQQGIAFTRIRIGDNTWIGNSSVIMADIGENSVIGAGSVVVQAMPPNCVAVGNPCRVKKRLGEPAESVESHESHKLR